MKEFDTHNHRNDSDEGGGLSTGEKQPWFAPPFPRYLKGVAGIFLVFLLITVFYFVSVNNSKENVIEYRWLKRGVDSTAANLDAHIRDIDEKLNDTSISESGRKLLSLLKAMNLITVRRPALEGDNIRGTITEAMDILESLYHDDDGGAEAEYSRNVAIAGMLTTIITTSYPPSLGGYLPAPFDEMFEDLKRQGYEPRPALMLAYRELAYKGITDGYRYDLPIVTMRAYIGATYLFSFSHLYPQGNNEGILTELKEDVMLHDLLETKTLGSYGRSVLVPAFHFAFAQDIARTYGNASVDEATNKLIDSSYEQARNLIHDTGDKVLEAIMKGKIDMFYLESLHRRYGNDELNEDTVIGLVDEFIASVSYSEETKNLFGSYLARGKTDSGKWEKVRTNFYEVAKKYPKLSAFVEEISHIEL